MLEDFEAAPDIRPCLNVGAGFDVPTGRFHFGERGESYLNGGLWPITGLGGRGNTFKSTLGDYFGLAVLNNYFSASELDYDTEFTKSPSRKAELAGEMPYIDKQVDILDKKRLKITDKGTYPGNVFFEMLRTRLKKRKAEQKSAVLTTPFYNAREKRHQKALAPFVNFIDAFSLFTTDNVDKMVEDNEIGDSGRNMQSVRGAMSKHQLMLELPELTAMYGCYSILTAHMGDDVVLDPYAAPKKKLEFMKNGLKFKDVPEKYSQLTNNCYFIMDAKAMIHPEKKTPEYPRNKEDDLKGDTDLMCLTYVNLRGKGGITGIPGQVILSQSEGVSPGLTALNYLRQYSRFGLIGNLQNYQLALKPDVNLSRTTVRGKLKDNLALNRAFQLTMELCQMINLWNTYPQDLICSPEDLFNDIKKQGYDWDELLNTRGYWTFEEDKHPLHHLSVQDLLLMRKGTYKPYWMQ